MSISNLNFLSSVELVKVLDKYLLLVGEVRPVLDVFDSFLLLFAVTPEYSVQICVFHALYKN